MEERKKVQMWEYIIVQSLEEIAAKGWRLAFQFENGEALAMRQIAVE